ncbi:8578_t:CDS:1 [Funneliformis mosseae]|uniref:8578_t:CDS:1 n=1 Tax=Funneliformis mosseae TaxID=27381 RepID=A0A9N9DQG6_FUNMO|nr:8578_t:CDS:1 [Funneliformis mosseae]
MEDDDPLEEYLNSPIENINILAYWKIKSEEPQWIPLINMARDYLIVQTTSVPKEQIFSLAKFTVSSTRNRLNPESLRISCLKIWFAAGLIEENFMEDNNNDN